VYDVAAPKLRSRSPPRQIAQLQQAIAVSHANR